MAQKIKAIRGMNDTTPEKMPYWHKLENACRELMQSYAYQEIRFPIVESTDLFKRSIGDATDIVEKEMYSFDDRNGDSLTLRPEGTAGCVRAGIENNLLYNQIRRLWYTGPMYRHERPQKGRYRQFYQIGVEAYGMNGPEIDVEIILLSTDLLKRLGLIEQVELQINSLGHPDARKAYRDILVEFLQKHKDKLDEDSQRRLSTNPLRILDSKNPDVQAVVKDAPKLMDHLDDDSKAHFAKLKTLLDANNINYVVNPNLVRGLDYYGYTVFEWVTNELGAQGTVIAGGRYNGLVEQLGGKDTPAVGFAAGLERLILMMENNVELKPSIDIYCVIAGDNNVAYAMQQIRALRQARPELTIEADLTGGKFKNQFKRADMSGAKYALIIGDDEQQNKTISIKDMSGKTEQQTLSTEEAKKHLLRTTSASA